MQTENDMEKGLKSLFFLFNITCKLLNTSIKNGIIIEE